MENSRIKELGAMLKLLTEDQKDYMLGWLSVDVPEAVESAFIAMIDDAWDDFNQ